MFTPSAGPTSTLDVEDAPEAEVRPKPEEVDQLVPNPGLHPVDSNQGDAGTDDKGESRPLTCEGGTSEFEDYQGAGTGLFLGACSREALGRPYLWRSGPGKEHADSAW